MAPKRALDEDKDSSITKKKIKTNPCEHFNILEELVKCCKIVARVIYKSDLNNGFTGEYFHLTMMDSKCKFRACGFGQVARELFEKFEMNKVYEISNFNVNVANPKYNPFGNTYEMILKIDTNIKQVDSESDIPEESQLFISFTEFHNKNQDEFVDVLGIITRVDDVSSVFIKQKEVMKRDIVIKNVENEIINVVFWRKKAEEFSGKVNDVICIKGGKVNVFRGNKTLSVQMSSAIKINDDSIDEVKSLMESVAEE